MYGIHHPDYNETTMQYDFSLIELIEEVDFTAYPDIRPICLPEDDDEDFVGVTAWLTAWEHQGRKAKVCI